MSNPLHPPHPLLEEVLRSAASTSVEEMYRLQDEELERLRRLNTGLSKGEAARE